MSSHRVNAQLSFCLKDKGKLFACCILLYLSYNDFFHLEILLLLTVYILKLQLSAAQSY